MIRATMPIPRSRGGGYEWRPDVNTADTTRGDVVSAVLGPYERVTGIVLVASLVLAGRGILTSRIPSL
jgi:hypothetical protein